MKKSAGILLYKKVDGQLMFFLAHPGGPFWKNKDAGSWSIPKGEFTDELPLDAALREFEEETGTRLKGEFIELEPVKMKSGKMIYAFAFEGDIDPDTITSNTFDLEWPPKSGKIVQFPEVDRAVWFRVDEALVKVVEVQGSFVREILEVVG
ncbi:MAG TPA: NUDIX domain-containing protein [Flavobacterium sp.]|jgi:predicted NUDIX family NTP pyrophosphohydrolase|nr:NUDIX domain-containing protein [Flavobacterium sp.]